MLLGRIRRKIQRSLLARGCWGTVRLSLLQPYLALRFRKVEKRRIAAQAEFDRAHGVDTTGIISLNDLEVESPNLAFGTRYGPTPARTFHSLLRLLQIDRLEDYTFIDIGSGKGAVLLYASEYPFERIIGIEFSPELHQIAERNLRVWLKKPCASNQIESICADATKFPFPLAPLVIFCNVPFDKRVSAVVAANLKASLTQNPRTAYLIWTNPSYQPGCCIPFDQMDSFQVLRATAEYRIYCTAGGGIRYPKHGV